LQYIVYFIVEKSFRDRGSNFNVLRGFIMSQYGYSFKGKYFILGAIGVLGLIFTDGWVQILFGIYTAGCVIGAIKGDN